MSFCSFSFTFHVKFFDLWSPNSENLGQVKLAWTHFSDSSRPPSTSASKHLKMLGILLTAPSGKQFFSIILNWPHLNRFYHDIYVCHMWPYCRRYKRSYPPAKNMPHIICVYPNQTLIARFKIIGCNKPVLNHLNNSDPILTFDK